MQGSIPVKAVKLSTRQLDSSTARQLDSSTAEAGASMHELVAPLDGMALFEVYPSRKVSLDKCSHQGSAHLHQYTLHGDPSHRGVLAPGAGVLSIPAQLWGAPHTLGGSPRVIPCSWKWPRRCLIMGQPNVWGAPHSRDGENAPSLGASTPGGRDHRARYTDANVHSLDGYTCQGTPSLMDERQMKPCTSLGGSSWHLLTPRRPLDDPSMTP